MHCAYCGMPKGTSWAEATLNSEKIKLVALAIIELCISQAVNHTDNQAGSRSVSQSVSQSVGNSVNFFFE